MAYNQRQVEQLAAYLKRQKEAGYSITTLRNYLISKGYDAQLVNAAVDLMYKPEKKRLLPSVHIPGRFLIYLLFIVLVIGGVAIGLIYFIEGEAPEAEVRIPTPVGEEVTGPVIEEVPVPEPTPKPEPAPIEEPEPVEEVEPEEEIIVRPLIEEGAPDPSAFEIETLIKKSSENKGLDYCTSVAESKQNTCFKHLALEHNKSKYCGQIDDSSFRDSCYIMFAFAGDFTVCDKIENKYRQLSCRSLGRTRQYNTEELLAIAKQSVRPVN
jgi:hypothetical protein